jgi:hypothetical protein
MNTFQQKSAAISRQRYELRAKLIEKMRTNPTMKDSETLRMVENDITFWEQQTDLSVDGLLTTLEKSLTDLDK